MLFNAPHRRSSSLSRRPASSRQRRNRRLANLERLETRNLLATLFWQGDVDTNWSNAGNWAGDAAGTLAGAVPQSNDTLVFSGANVGLVSFTANNDVAGLTNMTLQITDASAAGDFTIGGAQSLGLLNLASNITTGTATTVTTPITNNAGGIIATTAGQLNVNSAINLSGNLLTVNTSGAPDPAGNITLGGTITGAGGITKNNLGTLTVSGNNNYTGVTTSNRGILIITNANSLGAVGAGNETVINGNDGSTSTELRLSPAAGITVGESLKLAANATGRVTLRNSAQANTLTGPCDVSSTGNLVQVPSDSGSLTFTGDISGTMTGGSLFFLRGVSTSTANSIQGSLNLTGGNLAKTDAGLWVVGAAGKTYSWANLQVSVGTIRLGAPNINPATSQIILGQNDATAQTLDLNGFSQTAASISITSNGTSTLSTGAGTLTVNGNITTAGNGAHVISGLLDLGGAARTFTIANGTSATDLNVTALVSNGGVIKAGAGLMALGGANTFAGNTVINAGVVQANSNSALGTGSVTVSSTATSRLNLGAGVNVANSLTINGGSEVGFGALHVPTGAATYSGPINITASTSGGGHFGGGTLTLSNAITSSVAVVFRLGTVIVSGSGSSYTAATLGQGTLQLGANDALPTNIALTLAASAAGTFDLNGFNQTVGSIIKGANAANVTNSAASTTSTLSIGNGNITSTYAGILENTGTLNVTKVGTGTLTLSGANTYSGATTVNDGVLKLGAADVIPDGTGKGNVTVTSPGTLDLNGFSEGINGLAGTGIVDNTVAGGPFVLTLGNNNATATFSGAIKNTAGVIDLVKVGSGTQTLSGSSSYTGATTVNQGVLSVGSATALGNTTGVTLNNSVTAGGQGTTLNLAGTFTVSGIPLIMNSTATGNFRTALASSTGTNSWAGPITLQGDNLTQFFANGGNLTVAGPVSGPTFTGTAFFRGASGSGNITGVFNIPNALFNRTDSANWTVSSTGNVWLETRIATGRLILGVNDALPTVDIVNFGQPGSAPILDLNGKNQTVAGLGIVAGATGTFTITSTAAATLTVNNAVDGTFPGVITGAVAVTKSNTGTLTLTGANTYTGATTINGGVLSVPSVANNGTASPLGSGTTVNINNAGILQYTGNTATATNRTFAFGGSAGANSPRIQVTDAAGDLQVLGGTISGDGQTFGKIGPGTLTLGGATTGTLANLYVAGGTTLMRDSAALTVTGTTGVGANDFFILGGGSGTFSIQDSAAFTSGVIHMGENNGGATQTNFINQSGGTVTVTSNSGENAGIRLGHWGNETSTYNLSGGTLTLADANADTAIATDGTGAFNQTGGTLNSPGIWVNHRNAGGTATLDISGGVTNIGARGLVIAANSATIRSNANVTSVGSIGVGRFATGTLNVQDSAILTTNAELNIGDANGIAGIVNQTGGTVTIGNRIRNAHWPNNISNYNLSAGTLNVTNAFNVGWDGVGAFTMTGGNANVGQLIIDANGLTGPIGGQDDAATISGGTLNAASIQLAGGTLNVSNSANINVSGTVDIGAIGAGRPGVINQSGGTFNVNGVDGEAAGIRLGHWPGATSTYNLSGGSLNITNPGADLAIGVDGDGVFNQTGGTFNTSGIVVNHRNAGGSAIVDISGGTTNIGARGLIINANTATIRGNANVTSVGSIGVGRFGTGTLNLQGTATLTTNDELNLGDANGFAGIVNQSGGTFNVNNRIRNGHWPNNVSAYNLSGGTLNVTNALNVGWDGIGTFNQTGGTTNAGSVQVDANGATGPIGGQDDSLSVTAGLFRVGGGGGTINVTQGTATFGGTATIQAGTISVGQATAGATLNLQGTATVTAANLFVGEQNGFPGTVNQSGATVNLSGQLRVGHWPNETSSYNISGGALNLTAASPGTNPFGGGEQNGVIYLGIDGTGNMTQSGGAITAAGLVLDNRGDTAGVDTFTQTAGTLILGNWGIQGNATSQVNLGGSGGIVRASATWASSRPMTLSGTGANAVTFDTNGFNINLTGVLDGAGGLNKSGTGTLTLGGTNTYAGATTINGGVLSVANVQNNGTASNLGTGTSVVFNGGALQYTGAGAATTNRNLTLTGAANIDVSNAAGSLTLTAPISGAGQRLTKVGTGTLILNTTGGPNSLATLDAAGGNLVVAGSTATNVSGTTRVGVSPGSQGSIPGTQPGSGTLTVQDTAALTTQFIYMGENAGPAVTGMIATLNQTGGTVTTTGSDGEGNGIRIGHWPNNTSTYNLSGGTLNVNNNAELALAIDGTGFLTQTGGVANVTRGVVNARNVNGSGTFSVSGGVFNIGAGGIVNESTGPAAVNFGGAGGTLRATANWGSVLPITLSGTGANAGIIDTNGFTVTLSGVLSGAGGLTKVGLGTLILNGTSTYSGDTEIKAGTLAGDGAITSKLTLQDTATLAPGGTPGDFASGSLTLNSGSIFSAVLNGPLPATGYDQQIVSGTVTINGATLSLTPNFVSGPGQIFVLIANDGTDATVGSFAGLPEGSVLTVSGQKFFISYNDPLNRFGTGNDVALIRNNGVDAVDDTFGPILMNTVYTNTVKANDIDPDKDGLVSIVSGPTHGSVEVVNPLTGEFRYTPDSDYVGTDTFTYRLFDGEFGDTATVTLTVERFVLEDGILYVAGTNSADRIIVEGGTKIRYNNKLYGPFSVTDHVVVYGNRGSDTITVGSSSVMPVAFYGGEDSDYLAGGNNADTLDGGEGSDRLLGGNGNDVIYGGEGADTASGGSGNDLIFGDEYLDTDGLVQLADNQGRDTLSGDAGNDTIYGHGGMDTLNGGVGNDFLRGGDDGDTLDGGDGSDTLVGDAGGDKLYGRAGADVLLGGFGFDTLLGGTSADLIYGSDLTDDTDDAIQAIASLWFSNQRQAAADQLASIAQDDDFADTLNGEADADWYLIYALDTLLQAAEKNAPNKVIKLT